MPINGQAAGGVTVPDTKLARDATDLVRGATTDLVYHHSRRVFWWGNLQGRNRGLSFDPELLYIGAMFHDLGLNEEFRGSGRRFEVDGADEARRFLQGHGVPEDSIRRVWTAIALVEALVVAAYASLGSAVDGAARAARSHEPAEQVMAIAHAYRRWALAHPRRYSMLFSDRGPGQADPPAGIAAINVGMLALLAALQEISPADDGLAGGKLGQQLVRWGRKTGADPDAGPVVLRLGVVLWSRVHGLVSLELGGVLDSMGIDGELLLTSEVEAVTRNGS